MKTDWLAMSIGPFEIRPQVAHFRASASPLGQAGARRVAKRGGGIKAQVVAFYCHNELESIVLALGMQIRLSVA